MYNHRLRSYVTYYLLLLRIDQNNNWWRDKGVRGHESKSCRRPRRFHGSSPTHLTCATPRFPCWFPTDPRFMVRPLYMWPNSRWIRTHVPCFVAAAVFRGLGFQAISAGVMYCCQIGYSRPNRLRCSLLVCGDPAGTTMWPQHHI